MSHRCQGTDVTAGVAFVLNTKSLGSGVEFWRELTNRFAFTTLLVHAESSPKDCSACLAENASFDFPLLSLAVTSAVEQ